MTKLERNMVDLIWPKMYCFGHWKIFADFTCESSIIIQSNFCNECSERNAKNLLVIWFTA